MPRKRSTPDPLATVNQPRWLVIQNRCSEAIRSTRLEPGADLKKALADERARMIAEGWSVEPMTRYSFLFATRDADRVCIVIQAVAPGAPLIGHGTFLGAAQPGKR